MSFSVVKTLRVITLLSVLLQLINCDRLKCGKDNPSKESHCTKYGTDSGFLCFWISSSKESDSGKCGLMSYGEAKDLGIKGEQIITNADGSSQYYSCGNASSYLKLTLFSIALVCLFLL